jgi:hypothetical protein
VLLVGDASLDPKNYLEFGEHDFVLTKLIDTDVMETASDDWLADVDGDGLAEMAVGHLPVRTVEAADRLVAKIVGYNQAGAGSGVVLVADLNDGFDFGAMDEALWELIPPTVPVEEIDRGQMGASAAKSQLLASLNRGPALVNYTGHGSWERPSCEPRQQSLTLMYGGPGYCWATQQRNSNSIDPRAMASCCCQIDLRIPQGKNGWMHGTPALFSRGKGPTRSRRPSTSGAIQRRPAIAFSIWSMPYQARQGLPAAADGRCLS